MKTKHDMDAIESAIDAAVDFAASYHDALDAIHIAEFVIDDLRRTFERDSRLPKMSVLEFDLFTADLRNRIEQKIKDQIKEFVAEFAATIVNETTVNLQENTQ